MFNDARGFRDLRHGGSGSLLIYAPHETPPGALSCPTIAAMNGVWPA